MADKKEITGLMGRDAYAELTGLEIIRAEAGNAEVRLPVTPDILNGHGNVHGGALYTLADYTSAVASNLFGTPTIAANGSISYLKPVRSGYVTARAKTVKAGKRMNFQVVELYDAEGGLAAVFQGSSITVKRKTDF